MTSDSESPVNSWTVILGLLKEIDKRYEVQFKAMAAELHGSDRRYQERYIAQQEALTAALIAQKEAVAAALLAQKETTSETAKAATKQFDAFSSTITNKLDALTTAGSLGAGSKAGLTAGWQFLIAGIIAFVALASFLSGHLK